MNDLFEVGEMVRVVDDPKLLKVYTDGNGFRAKNPNYVSQMDEFCGEIALVDRIICWENNPIQYYLKIGDEAWWFKEDHLLLLEDNEAFAPISEEDILRLMQTLCFV